MSPKNPFLAAAAAGVANDRWTSTAGPPLLQVLPFLWLMLRHLRLTQQSVVPTAGTPGILFAQLTNYGTGKIDGHASWRIPLGIYGECSKHVLFAALLAMCFRTSLCTAGWCVLLLCLVVFSSCSQPSAPHLQVHPACWYCWRLHSSPTHPTPTSPAPS